MGRLRGRRASCVSLACVNRRSLLASNALASTLIFGLVAMPSPALAVDCLTGNPPPPGPILKSTPPGIEIRCVNISNRTSAGNVIDLQTNVAGGFITLIPSGRLISTGSSGISTATTGLGLFSSPITIANFGPIAAGGTGISAVTAFGDITLHNHGDIAAGGVGTGGCARQVVAAPRK
jgi:hypothetical protein